MLQQVNNKSRKTVISRFSFINCLHIGEIYCYNIYGMRIFDKLVNTRVFMSNVDNYCLCGRFRVVVMIHVMWVLIKSLV